MRTIDDLRQKQALPLDLKIRLTKRRIREWVNEFGLENVYISFSGGKDSTVLLKLAREEYPDIEAVFVDTGLEYPEIRQFVKSFDHITWVKPDMNFKEVIQKYGYPFISKEVAHKLDDRNSAILHGHESYVDRQLNGTYISKNGKKNMVSIESYKFLTEAPFKISHRCCNVMKKDPLKKHGGKPITAQMADESMLRRQMWIRYGCNAFQAKKQISNPMSFWTEQDVLQYIITNNIKLCSVYGDIIERDGKLTTTGCNRTGCMFCGFGCHLMKPGQGKFELMKETHPTQYDYIMRPWEEGGLNYKEVIDWLNEHGNLHIRY